ncbi:MAG: hypothetical protein K2Q26_04650 [Bdellovibrionales bacterium]|nr:hypothetical protein [Bdellovibrionales bacterium]
MIKSIFVSLVLFSASAQAYDSKPIPIGFKSCDFIADRQLVALDFSSSNVAIVSANGKSTPTVVVNGEAIGIPYGYECDDAEFCTEDVRFELVAVGETFLQVNYGKSGAWIKGTLNGQSVSATAGLCRY